MTACLMLTVLSYKNTDAVAVERASGNQAFRTAMQRKQTVAE